MLIKHDPYTLLFDELNEINCVETEEEQRQALRSTQQTVSKLRNGYANGLHEIDYSNSYQRAGYLLAYYPHHIEPIYHLLCQILQDTFQSLQHIQKVKASFFGAGPGAEILGWLLAIKNLCPNIQKSLAYLFDKYHWNVGQNITRELANQYWYSDYERKFRHYPQKLDLTVHHSNWSDTNHRSIKNSDMLIMQHCLNDELGKSDIFYENMKYIIDEATNNTIFIIIDVVYGIPQSIMLNLEDYATNKKHKVLHSIRDGKQVCRSKIETPEIIREELYVKDNIDARLLERKQTQYFGSVIQIKQLDQIPF